MYRFTRKSGILFLQAITFSRAVAALSFTTVALQPQYLQFAALIYLYACFTDLIDGYLARLLGVETPGGHALDLFADKFLTVTSALYAVSQGMPSLPCVTIIFREIFLTSFRSFSTSERQLFPPQRFLGGVISAAIWGSTYCLIQFPDQVVNHLQAFRIEYWLIGIVVATSTGLKIKQNWSTLKRIFEL